MSPATYLAIVSGCVELRNAVNNSCRISDKYYVVLNLAMSRKTLMSAST